MLEPPPVVAGHAQVGVEVKPVEVGVARPRGGKRAARLLLRAADRHRRFQLKEERVWYPYTAVKSALLDKIIRWVWGTPLGRFLS